MGGRVALENVFRPRVGPWGPLLLGAFAKIEPYVHFPDRILPHDNTHDDGGSLGVRYRAHTPVTHRELSPYHRPGETAVPAPATREVRPLAA